MLKGLLLAVPLMLVGYQNSISDRGGGYNNIIGPPAYSTGCSVAGTSTTENCSITAATGDFIALFFTTGTTAGTVSSVTDSNGTLTAALSSHPVTFGTKRGDFYYEANAASGNHTITVTMSTSLIINIMVADFTGAAASPIDGTPTSNVVATGTNPLNCSAVTTTQNNDTIIAGGGTVSNSVAVTAGAGYTMRQQPSGVTVYGLESGTAATAGSYASTFANSSTTAQLCVELAIKHL
jgi:hypothetical protein